MASIAEEEGLLDNIPIPADSSLACDNIHRPVAIPTTVASPDLADILNVMSHAKVENYLLQLSTLPVDDLNSPERATEDLTVSSPPTPRSPVQEPLVSVSGGPKAARRERLTSEDDANTSVCSSRVSRMSDLSNLTGRFIQGAFYGMPNPAAPPVCPFPDEWQYNTIPEVIENDEEID